MATYREILESILIEKPVPYNPNIHTKSGNAVLDKKGNKIGSYSKNKAGKAVVKPLKAKPDREKPSPEKEPVKHHMFVWFVVWSSIVHGGIMAYQAIIDDHEMGHFLGDIPALFILAILAGYTLRKEQAKH